MMLLPTYIYSAICFILIQNISGHAKYVTNNFSTISFTTKSLEKSWPSRTSRTKRSIYNAMPAFLKMAIQLERNLIIKATLSKQQPVLANEYLPVIVNQVNPFKNVMEDVGEFVMYYDTYNCIAIVYFGKIGAFYGIIGLNYYIAHLPYYFDVYGNYLLELIGKPYVNENDYKFFHINPSENYPPPSDTDAWEDFLRPVNCHPNETHQLDTQGPRPSTSRQLSEQDTRADYSSARHTSRKGPIYFFSQIYRQYYIETLVLVTHDLAEFFKENFGEEEYITAIVRYHVIYFNAVNMLLKKLGKLQNERFEVLINIAKIVIEGASISFGFESKDELQFTDVTSKLPLFFSHHSASYEKDSFDYVFVHTSHSIMDENILVDAISKYGQDMIQGRKTGTFYETVPITVAKFKNFYAHYAVAAHEIVRTLGVKIIPKENRLRPTGQCSGIMQRDGPKCSYCLDWTEEDIYQILTFFSKNRNCCFLLNEPRSLHPLIVIRMVTPNKQCQCLGYESYIKLYGRKVQPNVRFYGCSEPLQCDQVREHQVFHDKTILPFDGTPCGNKKACWSGNCQPIGMPTTIN